MNSYDNIPKISRIFHLIKNVNSAIVYLVKANGIYLKKEVFILRKKSHILLARYLADQMPANVSLQSHRKAFCLGNILPDIQPSFVTKRHEYFGTYNEVRSKITELVGEGAGHWNERVFWRRTGEVMHYIADYFTFPHNRTFDGCVTPHCHFMCTECGQVLDLETDDMSRLMEKSIKNFSGKITGYDIRFFGICPKCITHR